MDFDLIDFDGDVPRVLDDAPSGRDGNGRAGENRITDLAAFVDVPHRTVDEGTLDAPHLGGAGKDSSPSRAVFPGAVLDDENVARSRGFDSGGPKVLLRRSALSSDELHRHDAARDLVGAGQGSNARDRAGEPEPVEGVGDGAGVEPRQPFGYRHGSTRLDTQNEYIARDLWLTFPRITWSEDVGDIWVMDVATDDE
jgi:hypothetical protein